MRDTRTVAPATSRIVVALLATALLAGCASNPPQVERRDLEAQERAPLAPWRRAGVLGPGDQLDIYVWGYPDYTRRAVVGFDGTLPYPVIGELRVAGRTLAQVQEDVRVALTDLVKDPVVRVTLAVSRPRRVQVLGQVAKPGVYGMAVPDATLTEMLASAGGLTPDARHSGILVVRDLGKQVEIHTIDLRRIARDGDASANPVLQDGDIVVVPLSVIADVAREASRLATLIGTLLLFQNVTLLWEPFTDALLNRPRVPVGGNPIVVTP
jgi:polysaccharide export outer membrane protein